MRTKISNADNPRCSLCTRNFLFMCSLILAKFIRSVFSGSPFYTVVTYYPYYEDQSHLASLLRVFFYITWLYMMLPMMSADCLPITHLITLAFKFVTLCNHFERIRKEFDRNILTDKKAAVQKLKAGFLEGVQMHQKLLL